MNWIDEKVEKTCQNLKVDFLLKSDSLLRAVCFEKELKTILLTALQEAHQRGVEEERKRVLEWVKKTDVVGERFPVGDLINFINKV